MFIKLIRRTTPQELKNWMAVNNLTTESLHNEFGWDKEHTTVWLSGDKKIPYKVKITIDTYNNDPLV